MAAVDLVVVNYRTPGDLEGFVTSVEKSGFQDYSLTVVDVDPILEVPDLRCHTYIRTDENIGYARSCNLAAANTTLAAESADVMAFFNADVRVLPGSIERCLATMLSRPDAAVVGPRQTNSQRRITSAGVVPTRAGGCKPRGWRELDRGQYNDVVEMMTVSGSAYFVRRTAWDELAACPLYQEADPGSQGAFLQTPHYFEETWVSYHARAHGWKVIYDGCAHMLHEWHQASPVGGWAERHFPESQRLFRAACAHHGIECD